MANFNKSYNLHKTAALLILFVFILSGCADIKDVPEQVNEDIPNPVSDFTVKDQYIKGLKWYEQGEYNIAKKFWKPLAQSGDCDSQYGVGLLYLKGLGMGRNYDKAIALWQDAAKRGHGQAQNGLGAIYSRINIPYTSVDCKKGCGEEKDLIQAFKWFGIAVKNNSPRSADIAEKSLNRIRSNMTIEQINEAEFLVDGWQTDSPECVLRDFYLVGIMY